MAYHYRIVADRSGLETDGADMTLTTTSAADTGPVITQSPQDLTVVAGQPAILTAAATGSPYALRVWQVSTDDGVNFSQQTDAYGTQCISTGVTPTTDTTALSVGADNTGMCPAGITTTAGTRLGLRLPVSLANNGLEFEVSFETPDGETVTSDPATLTVIAAPATTTTAAGAITATTADFDGTINPNGSAATYHFEYGTSDTYGSTTPSLSAGDGRTAVPITTGVPGLQPDTTYYYRLVTSTGPGDGDVQSFTTPRRRRRRR
jgi:hypothetical protein